MNMYGYDPASVLPESERDGWRVGLIGIPWAGPWPKTCGDLFVEAPNGEQAGLAWECEGPAIKQFLEPDGFRWGVFQVRFSIPVMETQDLVRNFHQILPLLKAEYVRVKEGTARNPGT